MKSGTMVVRAWSGVMAGLGAIGAVGVAGCGGGPKPDAVATERSAAPTGITVAAAPAMGTAIRAGGDMDARVEGEDGNYRSGPCVVDTPLPVGYPAPTPPGAIDLKTYPAVRLAEVAGTGNPDRGMNRAFWPLFSHIKKHDIAMTSPVEMNYTGMKDAKGSEPESWSMAFLYRRADMNGVGQEGTVVVRDAEPMTVASIGAKGDYSLKLVRNGMEQIEGWLAAHPEWKAAGEWRALYYNGPSLFFWNKWAEVQLPVRPSGAK